MAADGHEPLRSRCKVARATGRDLPNSRGTFDSHDLQAAPHTLSAAGVGT